MFTADDVKRCIQNARIHNHLMIRAMRDLKGAILANHPSSDRYLEEIDEMRCDKDSAMASARMMKRSIQLRQETADKVDEAMDRPSGIGGLRIEITTGEYCGETAIIEHRSVSQSDNMYVVAQIENGDSAHINSRNHYGLIILFDGEYKIAE